MRTRARVDDNHRAIVQALRDCGVSVVSLAQLGRGVPDLLCWHRDEHFLLEIKDGSKPPSARKLTRDEAEFHRRWGGPIHIVNSVEEALEVVCGV